MATNLLEAYKGRLSVAESYFAKNHNGSKMDSMRKVTLAKVLENTDKFLSEAFTNSVGTQRADMGQYKKFVLALTTLAVPNLIVNDLCIVKPMSSASGYVVYMNYVAGSNKGQVKQGDLFNGTFRLGDAQADYTGSHVNETHKATAAEVAAHKFSVKWTPVAKVDGLKIGETTYAILTDATQTPVADTSVLMNKDGTITFAAGDTKFIADAEISILYVYDNEVIPQNDLPIINAKLDKIDLLARARRIAIYYSQFAQFEAKNDYGMDLGENLAIQAVGELQYEIDTECVNMLVEAADKQPEKLTWSKTLPIGVSLTEHYIGFVATLEKAKAIIYKRTKKFTANYILIAADLLPILAFIPDFQRAPANTAINGPYFAGTVCGLRVYVSPAMDDGTFVVGLNGNDMQSSAAVFAPYMAVVPTQLLGYADGAMSQGFSTLYDMKILNDLLLVKGTVTD